MNDLHGQVEYNASESELGLTRMGTYLKAKEALNPDGTVILAAGDMWQGSADSNLTHGALVTECMNEIGFDAMAIGNHDFDWGDSYLKSNKALADFPFLGANINDKTTGQISGLSDGAYTMIDKDGVQIGIIGAIDQNCESDILASNVAAYDFPSYSSVVNSSAIFLRNQGADVVVLLVHSGSIESGVDLSNIDLAFGGHNHAYTNEMYSGVPFVEGWCNGKAVGHIQVTVNRATGVLTVNAHEYDKDLVPSALAEDVGVKAIYDEYYANDIKAAKEEACGYLTGNMSKSQLGKMAVQTMYEYGFDNNLNIDVTMHNYGGIRSTLTAGNIIYGDLYEVFPFDNYMIICTLTGTQLNTWLSEGNITYGYDGSNSLSNGRMITSSGVYRVLIIDYLSEQTNYYPRDTSLDVNTFAFVRDVMKNKFQELETINPYDYY